MTGEQLGDCSPTVNLHGIFHDLTFKNYAHLF